MGFRMRSGKLKWLMTAGRNLAIGLFLAAAFSPALFAQTESSISPSVAGSSSTTTIAPSLSSTTSTGTNISNGTPTGNAASQGDPTGAALAGSDMSPNLSAVGTAGSFSQGASAGVSGSQGGGGSHGASLKSTHNPFAASTAFGVSSLGWGASEQPSSGFQPSPAFTQAGFGPTGSASSLAKTPAIASGTSPMGGNSASGMSSGGSKQSLSGGAQGSLASLAKGMAGAKGRAGKKQAGAGQSGLSASANAREQFSQMAEEQNGQSLQGSGRSGGGGGVSYTEDFPDSTMSTAQLSPPDSAADEPVVSFNPSETYGFPDLTEKVFLKPSLHGNEQDSGGEESAQDTLKRIQRRLKAYSDEARQRGLMQSKSGFSSGNGLATHHLPSGDTLSHRSMGLTPDSLGPVLP